MKKAYTLGYATWTIDDVENALARLGAILVDIRLKPFSRKPGFSKGALVRRLVDRYMHVPELGNLNYKGGPIQLSNSIEGLLIVRQVLTRHGVILMCGCKDLERCHRRQVAELLQAQLGVEVEHLFTKK